MSASWEPNKDFWRHRKVVVTGGTGFLGSHLVAALSDLDADVVVVVRDDVPVGPIHQQWWSKVTRVRGDVRDQELMERVLVEAEAQTVLHLAAQTQVGVANQNPVSSFDSNIRGTWALLEAVRRSPLVQQTVVASSDKAYGTQPVLPYTEAMPLSALHPYDVSKAAGDMIAASYAHSFDVNVTVTRCGNFYGPGDTNWERLFPGIIRMLLNGQAPIIRSDGTLTRDYLYVEDGASSYLQTAEVMAEKPELAGEAFNFSAERPLTVLEVVALMQEAVGTDFKPDVRATASGEIPHQYLSAEKARAVLGWAPKYTFEEGLALTVAWYKATLGG
ncbi:MAG TPA: GDP-mannose 4,6-dehydratase [Acidimicrobiales bacterium]|jgi:CDP-glucose 4,6-dehydratase|nr:GDP-mannose 4,6-dehydratase [Acidimicrobiales bacterium]